VWWPAEPGVRDKTRPVFQKRANGRGRVGARDYSAPAAGQLSVRPSYCVPVCEHCSRMLPCRFPNRLTLVAVAVSTLSIPALSLRFIATSRSACQPGLTYARVSTAEKPFQLPPDGKRTPHMARHGVNNTSSSELAQTVSCVFAHASDRSSCRQRR
jgi:hypothetical protein